MAYSADKVREAASKCGLSCSEVLTRMIDYACDHIVYQKTENFELTFNDDRSMECEVSL